MFEGLTTVQIAAALAGGYLLGSIPFGVIVMKAAGAGDPRAIGSGNIGATNVLRSGRRDLAALTLLGDGGKGAVAVLIAWIATREAFFGHIFPVWLGFKGGKGVATFFGTLLAAAWPVGIIAGATWLLMAAVFRISSLAALTAALVAPIAALLLHRPAVAALSLVMAALIYVRHEANIGRLLKGEEPRMGGKKAT